MASGGAGALVCAPEAAAATFSATAPRPMRPFTAKTRREQRPASVVPRRPPAPRSASSNRAAAAQPHGPEDAARRGPKGPTRPITRSVHRHDQLDRPQMRCPGPDVSDALPVRLKISVAVVNCSLLQSLGGQSTGCLPTAPLQTGARWRRTAPTCVWPELNGGSGRSTQCAGWGGLRLRPCSTSTRAKRVRPKRSLSHAFCGGVCARAAVLDMGTLRQTIVQAHQLRASHSLEQSQPPILWCCFSGGSEAVLSRSLARAL